MIEAHTYRMQAHTNADDDKRYREDAEVAEWVAKDPVKRMEAYLADSGLLESEATQRITDHAETVAKTLRDG